MSGAASAQSVLERVLGQIDNATNLASVNGTFANIAENIGGSTTQRVYQDASGNVFSEADYEAGLAAAIAEAEAANLVGDRPVQTAYPDTTEGRAAYESDLASWETDVSDRAAAIESAISTYESGYSDMGLIEVSGLGGVDGSINNRLDGINGATQEAIASIDVSAIEWNMPTFDFGDMATTALGAVNTGDITLGVNSAIDEAATSTTNAISSVIEQIGGSADTGAIVLNVASNMTGVNGSINNVMEQVNGSIGNLSTTALGAVNTGTIISGVDAAVAGIVGSTSGGSNGQ